MTTIDRISREFVASTPVSVLNEALYIHHDIDIGRSNQEEMSHRLSRFAEVAAYVANRSVDSNVRGAMYRLICGADQLRSSLTAHASSEPDWNSMNRFMDDIVHLDELLSR